MKKKVLRKTNKCKKGEVLLLTFEKVKGAPIFFQGNNKMIGRIIDLALSKDRPYINGVYLHVKKWRRKRCFLMWENIVQEKKGNFNIASLTALQEIPEGVRRFSRGADRLHGKFICENNGDIIGIVEDVYFLPNSGKIVGYEVTEGLFADVKNGFKMLKCTTPIIEHDGSFFLSS